MFCFMVSEIVKSVIFCVCSCRILGPGNVVNIATELRAGRYGDYVYLLSCVYCCSCLVCIVVVVLCVLL